MANNSSVRPLKSLQLFRKIALLEGISFILLVFIAVPLKHFAGIPEAVRYLGWIHGLLFIGYLYALIQCSTTYSWKFGRVALFFLAALIPFAPFFVERKLKEEQI